MLVEREESGPRPDAPILMLDSGVGGLSVLTALREIMPNAPVIYAADLAGLPYGDKSEREIAARVAGLLGRMSERYQPRLACIACNTASTIALGMVRDVLEIPVVGTVPAIKPAASLTRSGVIGLLGTTATIRQPYVDNLEAEFAAGKTLIRHAAPELVGEAEAMLRGEAQDESVVRRVVEGLRSHDRGDEIDILVLACTHFPLLKDALAKELGEGVTLVDGSEGIARRIAWLTREQDFEDAPMRFVATGSEERLAPYRPALASYGFASAELF